MELEQPSIEFKPIRDTRRMMPVPPPVRLVSVDDVRLPATLEMAERLDALYVDVLRFARESVSTRGITYKAENFRLRFDLTDVPIQRDDLRPTQIDVPSLGALENELADREIEFLRQRGLAPGQDTLLIQDPAANWLQIGEYRSF